MITKNFILNHRFLVNATLNLIKDLEEKKEIRLEPRLISLLCLLSENTGKLVSRETLIIKIWNDYGGAEDGLNQAISFLRKALKDHKKEIIETIPKKGYVLHATISSDEPVGLKEKVRIESKKRYRIPVALLVLIFVGLFLGYRQTNGISKILSEKAIVLVNQGFKEEFETKFDDLNFPEKKTHLNTITTTGPNGAKYRLTAIGDKRPEFYINNELISESKQEEYSEIKDKMLRKLWERQKMYKDSLSSVTPE